jgi:[ribosomal protein S18]-alanine N-acetyltransferase
MLIRNYLPSDELSVRNLLLSNISNGYFVMEDMKMLDDWVAAQNKGIPAYPPSVADYFFVLETDKVIGSAGFYVLAAEKRAHLTWGMVDGNLHNQGYGKLLFQYRVNKITEQYPGFKITLGTSQYTYKYYEKLGMKTETITPNGYGNNYDKYYMRLTD